ncbi:MAG: YicC/YloC family endoribonuclease [Myxococcaceae bacterium]
MPSRSMTGFGSGRASVGTEEISVELKAVNHKFCEVKVRLPRELSSLEPVAAKQVKDRVARGAIDVTLRRASSTQSGDVPKVDLALAKHYRAALSEIAKATGVPDQPELRDIALQAGVLRLEEPAVDLDSAQKALHTALAQALDGLSAMRAHEGDAIAADLHSRLAKLRALVAQLELLAPRAVDEYKTRLNKRIAELSGGLQLEPARLVQEVALFADRTDVAEELTRLAAHFTQFDALLKGDEPAGRKLDFLVQEMHREVNTTGSKSQHPEISSRVVELKSELERLREQVQNVE